MSDVCGKCHSGMHKLTWHRHDSHRGSSKVGQMLVLFSRDFRSSSTGAMEHLHPPTVTMGLLATLDSTWNSKLIATF
jgi:hypothetical protein